MYKESGSAEESERVEKIFVLGGGWVGHFYLPRAGQNLVKVVVLLLVVLLRKSSKSDLRSHLRGKFH